MERFVWTAKDEKKLFTCQTTLKFEQSFICRCKFDRNFVLTQKKEAFYKLFAASSKVNFIFGWLMDLVTFCDFRQFCKISCASSCKKFWKFQLLFHAIFVNLLKF